MNSIRKALPVLLILLAAAAFRDLSQPKQPNVQAQAPQGNCTVSLSFTASGALASQSNLSSTTGTPCVIFGVTYNSSGTLSAAIQFETSPDNVTFTAVPNSICTPASSSVQPPCLIYGANPMATAATGSQQVKAYQPYWRLNVTSITGTGTGTIKVIGYILTASGGGGGGGGGGLSGLTPTAVLVAADATSAGTPCTTCTISGGNLSISTTVPTGAPAGTIAAAAVYDPLDPINLKLYGALGNTSINQACTISAGSALLTCASNFSSAQIGRSIAVQGAGAAAGTLLTVIDSVSSGVATIHVTATTATTGLYWQQAITGTDDTAAIASWITALKAGGTVLGRTGRVPAGIYWVSSALSLDGLQSLRIECNGNNREVTDFSTPQFLFMGSGNTNLLTAKSSNSVSIEGCGFSYANLGYTGNLIDISKGSGGDTVELNFLRCRFGGLSGTLMSPTGASNTGTQAGPAASLIIMNLVYDINIEKCVFQNAGVAIQGPTASYVNANSVRIRDNIFQGGFASAPIQFSGQAWTIDANTFEPMDNGYSTNRTCGGIQAVAPAGGSGTVISDGLRITGNSFEDAALASGICVDLNGTTGNGVMFGTTVSGNDFAFGGTAIRLAGGTGWNITGNLFRDFTTAVDGTNGTYPSSVVGYFIYGNSYQVCTNEVIGSHLSTGGIFDITDINGFQSTGTQGTLRSFGQFQDFTQGVRSTCASARNGVIQVEKGTWPGTSDRFTLCLNDAAVYQWVDIPLGSYTGPVSLTGQVASIGATNMRFGGAVLPVGLYEIDYYITVTTPGAASTVLVTFAWTDGGGGRTAASATVVASAANYTSGQLIVKTDGINDLVYSTTLVNSSTYSLDITVARVK